MDIEIKKLFGHETKLAKELFTWFQEEDVADVTKALSEDYVSALLAKPDFHVIVALDKNKIIGGLTAFVLPMYKEEINEIFLYEIGVEEAFQRKNIATELIEFLKKIAVKDNIQEMYVGTEMENIPAQKLYDKTGGKFEKIAWYVYKLD